MEKRWTIKPEVDQMLINGLANDLSVEPIIAELLVKRGIHDFDSAKKFFRPGHEALHDPFLMKNMSKAVKVLLQATEKNEGILVYGDYDVDGTSAVSLVYSFLKSFTGDLDFYIPDRYKEGYGLSEAGVRHAADKGFKWMICLDCGIKAVNQVELANSLGVNVIVCDHHQPGEQLPDAIILNPKQQDCEYPYKELTGCGVGFKLMHAFAIESGYDMDAVAPFLDLVALSIGADIVPITGENRTLAALGLQTIQENPRPAFKAILEPAGRLKNCAISDLVFVVAPRINAAGRMFTGSFAVKLMIEEDENSVKQLAEEINQYNSDRKDVEKSTAEEALLQLEDAPYDRFSNVVYNGDWHKGVIGIVASRIIEQHYRPTVVLTDSGDHVAGSVRSIKGFNVYDALAACEAHLIQFGGHKYAAGLTMHKEQIEGFKEAFEQVVKSDIDEQLLTPEILIDAEIDFEDIQGNSREALPKFYRILQQFAPFGPGNMRPVLLTKQVVVSYPRVVGESHLQFTAHQASRPDIKFRCIAFGMADKLNLLDQEVDLVYSLDKNEWNGRVNLQLGIKDLRLSAH